MALDKTYLVAGFTLLATAVVARCIVFNGGPDRSEDNAAAQSIDRDYGYDEGGYGHVAGGKGGLSAHAAYGFPEDHEGYGAFEDPGKHHGHYPEDHHHHHHHHHSHHDHHKHHDYHKALAIKGLLVPLAGVALLGAAAAFVSNPILLQLGVISGATTLGRRKREASSASGDEENRLKEIKLLERFMSQIPRQEIEAQEKKMLASYLSCSGAASGELCLERLACELHSSQAAAMPMEADVLAIIVNEILGNDFIPAATKQKIASAVERGRLDLECSAYKCEQLEEGQKGTKHEILHGKF